MAEGAVVSGPGAYSQRTDAGGQPIRALPNPEYGEATAYKEQQKAAPLSASGNDGPTGPFPSDLARMATGPAPSAPAGPPPGGDEPLPDLFGAGDPSVPMTSGVPMGAGPNSIPGMPGSEPDVVALRGALEPYFAGDGGQVLAAWAQSAAEKGLW